MMKLKYLKYTLYSLWISMLAACFLASCSQDEPAREQTEKFTLSFQLNTNGILTRAADDWEGPYPDNGGSSFDNTITSVDLFMLGEDNSIVKRLYALKDPDSSSNIYTCDVDEKTPGVTIDRSQMTAVFTGRIMALANVEDMQSPWYSPEGWENAKIPYTLKYGQSDDWHIPMWGVESYQNEVLVANKVTRLKDIYMLRAVSKIVIKLDPSIQSDYKISSVSMAPSSPEFFGEGYTLPNEALEKTSTLNLGLTGCFDPKTDDVETLSQPVFSFKDSGWECCTYVSESKTDEDSPFAFELTLKSKKEGVPDFTGTLKFSKYSQTNPTQPESTIRYAVRNHVYEFTINLAKLELIPTVKEWEMGGTIHIDMQ